MPERALQNMVVDKKRGFVYTAVLGAAGSKWSRLMVEMNKVDGKWSGNLVKMNQFLQEEQGLQFLSTTPGLFKFYFVRNPLDRVISGYFYYFADLARARLYLEGVAFRELANINNLNPNKLSGITFEQYLNWVVHGATADKHFGLQFDIIQPCHISYTLAGQLEILDIERIVVGQYVPALATRYMDFNGARTPRNLTALTEEARGLVAQVSGATLAAFYDKFEPDYRTWNYSTPEDWWYPYSGTIIGLREEP